MSIALIVTRGYGNGTLVGTIKDVVLRGYGISDNPSYPWDQNSDIDNTWNALADHDDTWNKNSNLDNTWTQ